MTEQSIPELPAACLDCGLPYADFGLDTVLPDVQWRAIHPNDGGLLCARCIVKRAATLPGGIVLAARLVLDAHHAAWATWKNLPDDEAFAYEQCGAVSGDLRCDRRVHTDGHHRGYNAQIDAPMFWGTISDERDAAIKGIRDTYLTQPLTRVGAITMRGHVMVLLRELDQLRAKALTRKDIDQILDGIDHFIIGPEEDPEVIEAWKPYIDKLKAVRP